MSNINLNELRKLLDLRSNLYETAELAKSLKEGFYGDTIPARCRVWLGRVWHFVLPLAEQGRIWADALAPDSLTREQSATKLQEADDWAWPIALQLHNNKTDKDEILGLFTSLKAAETFVNGQGYKSARLVDATTGIVICTWNPNTKCWEL